MPEPVKIVLMAQTEEAAAALKKFAADQGASFREVSAAVSHAGGALGQNRMALMELGHVARATGESLAFGMNPLKVLALESPRILQATTMMGVGFATMLPYIAAVGAAAGVGYLGWKAYMSGVEDTTTKIDELVKSLDKVPAILQKISELQKSGLVSRAAGTEFSDYLNGRKKLYVGPDGQITPDATTTVDQPVYRTGPGGATFQMGTETVTRQNPAASQEQINDYVNNQLPKVADAQAKAAAHLKELEEKAAVDQLSGLEKEKAAIHERYQKERDEIALTLQQAGNLIGPGQRAGAQQQIADLERAEKNAIADAEARAQAKRIEEQSRTEGEFRRAAAERTRDDLQTVEDQITAMYQQEGVKRGEFSAQEYALRMNAAQRAYYAGDIEEREYTHLVTEAAKKRSEAEKSYNAELEKTAALKKQIAFSEAELNLRQIEGNPFLTDLQKAQQSVPYYQSQVSANAADISKQDQIIGGNPADSPAALEAQAKKNELLQQNYEIQQKINDAENANSFSYQLGEVIVKLQNIGTLEQQAAQLFGQVWTVATQSISSNISSLILGTKNWRQALIGIYNTVVSEIVNGVVHMAVQWILQHAIMRMASKLFGLEEDLSATTTETAKTTAATVGSSARLGILGTEAAAGTAIVAAAAEAQVLSYAAVAAAGAAAAMADIPYVGPELAIASMAEVLATVLATCVPIAAFAQGGLVEGPGTGTSDSILARVSNGEYIFSAPAVQRIGLDTLETLHNGGSAAAIGGSGGAGGNHVSVYSFMDHRAMMHNIERDPAHEKHIVDVMRRNAHVIR